MGFFSHLFLDAGSSVFFLVSLLCVLSVAPKSSLQTLPRSAIFNLFPRRFLLPSLDYSNHTVWNSGKRRGRLWEAVPMVCPPLTHCRFAFFESRKVHPHWVPVGHTGGGVQEIKKDNICRSSLSGMVMHGILCLFLTCPFRGQGHGPVEWELA